MPQSTTPGLRVNYLVDDRSRSYNFRTFICSYVKNETVGSDLHDLHQRRARVPVLSGDGKSKFGVLRFRGCMQMSRDRVAGST